MVPPTTVVVPVRVSGAPQVPFIVAVEVMVSAATVRRGISTGAMFTARLVTDELPAVELVVDKVPVALTLMTPVLKICPNPGILNATAAILLVFE